MLVVLALSAGLGATAAAGSSPTGGKYRSYTYIAVSRASAAVYVNALVHQDSVNGQGVSPNRTVYLQRLLNGHWQNMLARQTDAHGRFTVGFLSAPSYSYRLIALAGTTTLAATSATATSPLLGGVLHPGQTLVAGNTGRYATLYSPSREFMLEVELGGSFNLLQFAYVAPVEETIDVPIQEIDGLPAPISRTRLTMEKNGNLTMSTAAGRPLWSSHTSGAGNSLYVQDDGDLVMYSPLSRVVWATHTTAIVLIPGTVIPSGKTYVWEQYPSTSPDFVGRFSMQRDGNLALYGKNKLVWSSHTHVAGSHAVFTLSGTLAVYSPVGTLLWRSRSYGKNMALIVGCGSLSFDLAYKDTQYLPAVEYPVNCGV